MFSWARRAILISQASPHNPVTSQRAQSIMASAVQRRWKSLRSDKREETFTTTWIHTRAARWQHGVPVPDILAMRHVPPQPSGAAIIASGDGAGSTKTEKAAGWGGVLYAPEGVQRSAPSVDLKAGPIVCEPGQPGYRWAKAPTNNAAELEAIEQMIVAAATLAAEMGFVEVHSDSRLAIMAALGIPRKTKKKRRQPRGHQSGGTNGVNDALATRAREAPLHERGKSCMGA